MSCRAVIDTKVLYVLTHFGIEVFPKYTGTILTDTDMDDLIFYEAALEGKSYLITGDLKHYLSEKFIASPAEMINILHDDIKSY